MWAWNLVIYCIVKTEVVQVLSLEGHLFPESKVLTRSHSMWPERCDLMWIRLEQSQRCQVQPKWRGGFGGWLCQTHKISQGEWGLISGMRLWRQGVTQSRVTESATVLQGLVNMRSSWFLARWVAGSGGGEYVRSNVEKKFMNSDECSFSGWMLKSPRTTSCVPSSVEQLGRMSISSKKTWRGPGGW